MYYFPFNYYYKKNSYFDNSSTNQKPKILFKSINNILKKKNFNINRGDFNIQLKNDFLLKKFKFLIKILINSNLLEEIIILFNSTYSINFILKNLINFTKLNNEFLISNKEHNSIFFPLLNIFKKKKIKIIIFPEIKNKLYLNIFCNFFNNNSFCIIYSQISNNFGYIKNVKKINAITNYNNLISIIDITQSISYLNINIKKLKNILVFFSLHKLYSFTGISILYCNIFLIGKIFPFFVGGGNIILYKNKIKFKKFDKKIYCGTQNNISILSSYYSIKWFLSNKKYIFLKNLFFKKIIFLLYKKKHNNFSNIILLKIKNNIFNFILDLNKIITRCDKLCNFMKKLFLNKKNNCRISINFFNELKEFLKIKFLIFFNNFII